MNFAASVGARKIVSVEDVLNVNDFLKFEYNKKD